MITGRRLIPTDEAILDDLKGGQRTELQLFAACLRRCSPFVMEKDVTSALKRLHREGKIEYGGGTNWSLKAVKR